MQRIIAACGLICAKSAAYIATQNNDAAALAALAKAWSKEYNTKVTSADCRCTGCHSTVGPWMAHCAECKIRACGIEQQVEHCSVCATYSCDKLVECFGFVPEAKITLDRLRGSA